MKTITTTIVCLFLVTIPSAWAENKPVKADEQRGADRTPRQVAEQLAAVYGRRLDQVAYIPALPLIAKLRLSELTGDPKYAEEVNTIVAPFLRGEKSPVPRSGYEQAGHLIFAELALRAEGKERERWTSLCRAAADQIFGKDDKPLPVMPYHNEMSDAVFTAGPILAATGKLTGERKYFDAAATHFASMRKLCLRADGIYRHSPLCEAAWGRGNGFPALGLALALSEWPDDHPARKELVAEFQKHMAALKPHQDAKTGCWHQVIDQPKSYDEYSCTCMIGFAMQRGISWGWLAKDEYQPCVDLAWRAIKERTGPDGKLVNVCASTDKQKTLHDYLDRPAINGRDDRGGAMGLLFAVERLAAEQAGTIDTIIGSGSSTDNGPSGKALATNISQPFGLEFGPDGALYVCERGLHRIRRWNPKTNEVTTVAGTGKAGFSGDGGPATKAELYEPHELRFDHAGNLYWTDMRNHVIRRVDAKSGVISTYAGIGGKAGFGGDGGSATKANLNQPHSLAFDAADNMYIADIANHRIRRIDAKTGVIETIVGTGEQQLPKDRADAKTSPIFAPRALFVSGDVMWIALREGNAVWKMDLKAGTLHHVGGDGKAGFAVVNGDAKDARFNGPKGIAVGPDGMVYVVDSGNHVLRKIDPAKGTISVVAGVPGKAKFGGDGGPAAEAHLNNLHGVCITADGTIYIGDSDNHRVRRVKP